MREPYTHNVWLAKRSKRSAPLIPCYSNAPAPPTHTTQTDNKCTENGCSGGKCTGFTAIAGWDAATGLGSPHGPALVAALAAL